MAIEDLDLEFEDEEQEKKGDALDVDVDLSFSAFPAQEVLEQGARAVPRRPAPKPTAKNPTPNPQPNPQPNNVADINQAKPQPKVRTQPQVQARPTSQVQPSYATDSSEEIALLRAEIDALKNQMQKIQHQADVKVAVAQAEKEYLVEFVSNAKVLDHQVTQILTRINKKVPALGSEVQAIKKYVNEFVKKSIPSSKKEGSD